MTRYFFDTADGDRDVDDSGVELSGDDNALREAIRYAGSMIRDQPGLLATGHEFVVTVRKDGATPLAAIRMQLIKG